MPRAPRQPRAKHASRKPRKQFKPKSAGFWAKWDAAMSLVHKRAVATMSEEAVHAAITDLAGRRELNYNDPEDRWVIGRLAALKERGEQLEKFNGTES